MLSDGGNRYRVLTHGSTVHVAQRRDPARAREPLTYYTREGPAGQAFSVVRGLWQRAIPLAVNLDACGEKLDPFLSTGDWREQPSSSRPWTDDYSNIAGTIRWQRFW